MKRFSGSRPARRLFGRQSLLGWGPAFLTASILAWQAWSHATGDDYRVQDDARQHVFWLLRNVDPELFAGDPIADYFESVAPWLYRAIYQLAWQIFGLAPPTLAVVLPPLLGMVAVGYAVAIGYQLSPLPLVAGLAGLLCAQTLWLEDDLVSATPRAFATPLLLVFAFYWMRRNSWGSGLSAAALAGLYPPAALIGWGATCLRLGDRRYWPVGLATTLGLGLGLLPLALAPEPFGDTIAVAAARSMPEFLETEAGYGRAFFFHPNPLVFWGFGPRSGLLFWGLLPPLSLAAAGWLWQARSFLRGSSVPLNRGAATSIGRLALSAIGFYAIAHLLLFKLHFPARYTYHGLRTLVPLAAAVALANMACWQYQQWQARPSLPSRSANLALAGLQVVLLLLPLVPELAIDNQLYVTGRADAIYEFLQGTPPKTLVATLDSEGNNLPYFGRRATLVAREYALPYHPEYYNLLQQRARALLLAHAAPGPEPLQDLLERYPIAYLLMRENSFEPGYLRGKDWLHPFQPEFDRAVAWLESYQNTAREPMLHRLQPSCTVLTQGSLLLVDADCLRSRLSEVLPSSAAISAAEP